MRKDNILKSSAMRVAFCAITAALCLALMMLTNLVSVGTYAFPCFAGILLTAIVIEYGVKWALSVYAAVSVLSFFLAADKEAVVFFILIFGYYPILKQLTESKIRSLIVRWIIKLAVFNCAAVAAFFITTLLLSVSAEEYTILGVYIPWAFLIAGNVFFLIYDFALNTFIVQYVRRLREKIFGRK